MELCEVNFSGTPLCGFESVTNGTVLKFISLVHPCVDLRESPMKLCEVHEANVSKICVLDPIPTSLLFECSNEIVPLLTAIVNQSLSTGIFPSCMKTAIVKPILKKTSPNPNVLKNLGLF